MRIAHLASAILFATVSFGPISAGTSHADGLSGAYLAGKHAANISDIDQAGRYFARALARDSNNPVLMEQALIYQTAAGRVEQAIPIARALSAIKPDHRTSALVLTVADFASGRFETAQKRTSDTPEAFHPLVGAMLNAWAAHAVGKHDQVADSFSTLGDRAIFRIFAGYHTSLIQAANGDMASAAATMDQAMGELTAPTGRMARSYAGLLRSIGDNEKARGVYERAIAVAVGDAVLEHEIAAMDAGDAPVMLVTTPQEGAAEALYGLASALGQDGEKRLSLFYVRLALFLRKDLGDAALLAAELLEEQEQFDLAVRAYEAIPADDPLNRAAEIGRAEALRQSGEDAKAIEALRTLSRRMPNALDVHVALGDLMRRLKHFEEGAVAYERAIELLGEQGRESWVLHYERGICYERAGEWDRAEEDFFTALKLQPEQPLVLNYLGYSWLEKGLNLDQALDMIRKAVEQRPNDGFIVDSLGWAHYQLSDYDNAVEQLEKAVELQPVDPVINDHFGDALWRVGRRLEAEFQWKRAISFKPEEENLKRIKRKLAVGLDKVLAEETDVEKEQKAAEANDG
ncbi:MAG: tetratricopeptide repeat protein [Pikeienuella sp.]